MPKLLGNILKKHEALALSREFSLNLFQAVAMHRPLKIVGMNEVEISDEGKLILTKTKCPFFTVTANPLKVSRMIQMETLKKHLNECCVSALKCLIESWQIGFPDDPEAIVYAFETSAVMVNIDSNDLVITVELHVAGPRGLESKLNDYKEEAIIKEVVPLVQQSESEDDGQEGAVVQLSEVQEGLDIGSNNQEVKTSGLIIVA